MGKTRDHFKKIRDTKGTFHAKMGTIKDRNSMDLTEAEDIKKRWQEYTEELYKKELRDPDNHDGVITHLEPDILECEVKWALEIYVKRREAKSKEEKERYSHLNAEYQRIPWKYKKDFLNDQCKEIGQKNRMGKTRDFFKNIRDTKGTFQAKMGTIKDRNSMDLTEAKDIKKR